MDKKQYKWYVYQLIDPRNNTVFYIGKGKGNRIHEHEKEASNGVCSHKCYKINKIRNLGLNIVKQKIAYFNDEAYAYQFEYELISTTPNLTNVIGKMEKVSEPLQLEIKLPIPRPFIEIAKEKYNALTRCMGEFAYWYKYSNGGEYKVDVECIDNVRTKIVKNSLESIYNKVFPSFLQDIKKSKEIEKSLKNELKTYGVQYGC